jgi:hypothetical protein
MLRNPIALAGVALMVSSCDFVVFGESRVVSDKSFNRGSSFQHQEGRK